MKYYDFDHFKPPPEFTLFRRYYLSILTNHIFKIKAGDVLGFTTSTSKQEKQVEVEVNFIAIFGSEVLTDF